MCHSARSLGSELGASGEEGENFVAGRRAALSSSGSRGSSSGRGGGRGGGGPGVVKGVRAPEGWVEGDDDEVKERVEKGEPGCGGRCGRERLCRGQRKC